MCDCTSPERKTHRKIRWTQQEDELIKQGVEKFGTKNWSIIAESVSGRTGKQCRERWINQLNPDLRSETWTAEEDQTLTNLINQYGHSWSIISKLLPGRSGNSVKNRYKYIKRHMQLQYELLSQRNLPKQLADINSNQFFSVLLQQQRPTQFLPIYVQVAQNP